MCTQQLNRWLVLLVLCIFGKSEVEGLRVLGVFPVHAKSHFVMSESLMRGLAQRGHQVDVYSHFPLKKPPPNYTDYSLQGTMPAVLNNMTFDFMNNFSEPSDLQVVAEILGRPICNLLRLPIFKKLIDNPPDDPPYDVVVVEFFFSPCYLALGRHFKIPMVVITTSGLPDYLHESVGNPVNFAVDASKYFESTKLVTFFDRLKNLFLWHYASWSFDSSTKYQNDIVKEVFGPNFPSVSELRKDASLILINYSQALNGIKTFAPAVVPIAGIHISDSDELAPKVQKFLDESKNGFIYVSFGSMVRFETFPKTDIQAFYATFKKIAPVRVLMKIAVPEELPPGLPSNAITYSWLPQVKVLKHKNIKAFVTHGGLMGSIEAIYHGVPMIGFPLFADQPYNIRMYAERNLAIQLDRYKISEPTFTAAVNEILHNSTYKEASKKVGKAFRNVPISPIDSASFWIEYVVRHGKDSLRSPIVDVPWWQAHLLDVYGSIALTVLLTILILKFVLRKFVQFFFKKQFTQNKTKMKKN